ncbi:winged helix-turn-helix domain-containing protein [Streptomyces sp. NPDC005921]
MDHTALCDRDSEEPLTVLEEVERWLATRSWSLNDRPLHRILAAKQRTGQSVSVVLPALNEEETVGDIVAVIRHDLMQQAPLVDEIVVVDSGSTDRTAVVAAAAGARVVHLTMDEEAREVTRAGELIELSPTEFELLRFLMRNPRRVLSKAQILDRVWSYDFGGRAHVVELYISYLRKKVDAGREPMIHTVRGAGYVLKPVTR